MNRFQAGLTIALATLTAIVAAAAPPASAAAQPRWTGLTGPAGAGLRACVDRAQQQRPPTWTCMGGDLTTVDPTGARVTTTVAEDFRDTTATATVAPADDYDSWCENGTVCGRRISDYIAEVKGNGAYGDGNGVIGAFDFIVRQAFNGQRPRWRSVLIWDYGPMIQPQGFWNVCRINRVGPDGTCGSNEFYFGNVYAANRRSTKPSATGYYSNDQLTTGSGRYHDDNHGEFFAYGRPQLFYAPAIHTGRWNRCHARPYCRYHQVPWKS